MGKRFKIKPHKVKPKSELIKETEIDTKQTVSFNFKQIYIKEWGKFNYNSCQINYFKKLLERLKHISEYTKSDSVCFFNPFKFKKIDFKRKDVTEETFGFETENDENAWEFKITANKHGRIHGYFIGNVFYVVWFDPKHLLCKPKRS